MSKATKRKHVSQEILNEFPEPTSQQRIAQIKASRGGNLHEYQDQDGTVAICSMPTKFRKNVWIKRGDYVILEPIAEGERVKSEITHILYPDQIRHLKKRSLWPAAFEKLDEKEERRDMDLPPSFSDDEEDEDESEDAAPLQEEDRNDPNASTD